jgi:hypothetical protein
MNFARDGQRLAQKGERETPRQRVRRREAGRHAGAEVDDVERLQAATQLAGRDRPIHERGGDHRRCAPGQPDASPGPSGPSEPCRGWNDERPELGRNCGALPSEGNPKGDPEVERPENVERSPNRRFARCELDFEIAGCAWLPVEIHHVRILRAEDPERVGAKAEDDVIGYANCSEQAGNRTKPEVGLHIGVRS